MVARGGGFAEPLEPRITSYSFSPVRGDPIRSPLTGLKDDESLLPGVALRSTPGYHRSPLRGCKKSHLLRLQAPRFFVARQAALGADPVDLPVNAGQDRVVGEQAAYLDPVGPQVDRDRGHREQQVN